MKRKAVTIILTFLIVGILGLIAWGINQKYKASQLIVEPMGDGKGIFVGERRFQDKETEAQKWSPETRRRVEQHESNVIALNEGWKYIGIGNDFFRTQRYSEAAEAYKKSYELDRGGRPVSGFKLAETYEKLGNYNDAVSLLDELINENVLSETGVENAKKMRDRLLAAKKQADQRR